MLAVLTVRSRFDDPDMWWHLKTGQIIWTKHIIPTSDIFSYTTGHHAWVPHEWLSQTIVYGAYRFRGYTGLMLWLCVMAAALLVAGYVLCTLYSGNAKVGFVGAMTMWFFSTAGLAVRPQMIGYLLLILELLAIHLGRTRDPRWFFCLPPLFAVWINCHGSFVFGLIVGCLFLLCSFCHFQTGLLVAIRWDNRNQRIFGLSLLFSAAALFLNPTGVKQVLYPLATLLHEPVGLSVVDEWMPLSMNSARGLGVLTVLACIVLSTIVRRTELFLDEVVVLLLGTWLAVSHQRMVFVFGILVAPILTRLLSTSWDGYDPAHDHPALNTSLIAVSISIAFLAFPNRQNLARQVNQTSPVAAVDFIQIHHLSGNMLNEYVYGGYLIWTTPERPVFIDGRADVFEWTGVMQEFGRWATIQTSPNTLLNKYNVKFCLLARTSPMAQIFPLLPNWKQVYLDTHSVIFVRTVPDPARASSTAATNSAKSSSTLADSRTSHGVRRNHHTSPTSGDQHFATVQKG